MQVIQMLTGGFDANMATRETAGVGASGGETQTRWASTAADKGADGLLFDPLEARQLRARVLKRLFTNPRDAAHTMGRYRILDPLGSGAMGVVYAAYDEQLDRKVALKLLRGASNATDGRRRMLREAKALAQLSDPHVVQVHDAGVLEGEVFVAMEYVAGPTLRQWCEHERHAPAEIVDKFIEAGRGLAAAHDKRIIHRDFKPDNVLIGVDGRARVVDFGLAAGSEGPPDLGASVSAPFAPVLTQTGVVLGTPAYMAPEQFTGEPVDARIDQFAFAVALWEALFGQRPHAGKTMRALADAAGKGPPAVPRAAEIPPRVGRALRRALQADPADRFADMHELLRAIEPARHRRGRTLLFIVASALGLALTVGMMAMRRPLSPSAPQQLVASIDARAKVSSAERALDAAARERVLSEADLLVAQDPTRAVVRLRDLGDEPWDDTAIDIARRAYARGVAAHVVPTGKRTRLLGPVGDALALLDGRQLRLWRPEGEATLDLETRTPVVAPRGRVLFAIEPSEGRIATIDGAGARTELPVVLPFLAAIADPTGERLGLLRDTVLTIIDTEGRVVVEQALEDYETGDPIALEPGGDAFLWLDAHGGVRRSTGDDVSVVHGRIVGRIAATADGRGVAVGKDDILRTWSDGKVRELGPVVGQPEISTDGRTVAAWAAADGEGRACGGRLFQLDTGHDMPLCGVRYGSDASIAFSPDGRWLALKGPPGEVYVWNTDSGRDWQPVGPGAIRDVAFTSSGALATLFEMELRVWPLPRPAAARLSEITAAHTAVLVDDSTVFVTGSRSLLERWDMRAAVTTPVLKGHELRSSSLSSAGRGLAAVAAAGDAFVVDAAGEVVERIDTEGLEAWTTAISGDGEHVLLASAGKMGQYTRNTKSLRWNTQVCDACTLTVLTGVAFSEDSATASRFPSGEAWDVTTGQPREAIDLPTPAVTRGRDGTTYLLREEGEYGSAKQSFAYVPKGASEATRLPTDVVVFAGSVALGDDGLVAWEAPPASMLHDFVRGRTWSLPNQPALERSADGVVLGMATRYPMVVSRAPGLFVVSGPLGLERHDLDLGPNAEAAPGWARALVTIHPEATGE